MEFQFGRDHFGVARLLRKYRGEPEKSHQWKAGYRLRIGRDFLEILPGNFP